MTKLFNRDIEVMAGPLTISPRDEAGENQPVLKMRFDITKTNNREPNKAELKIWNLSPGSRSKLQAKDLEVVIQAGYVTGRAQIFKGDLETARTEKTSVDWITTLELGDGTKQMRKSRINKSFRGGQSAGQMLKVAAEALGLDTGNLKEKVASDGARSVLKQFVGLVLSGKATDVLDDVASAMGLTYSVQDKSLQFLSRGEAVKGPAIKLNPATGLVGSPDVGEKGVVTASSLLNGRIRPGSKIDLTSLVVTGSFVCQKVQHVGDTWGAEWGSNIEMAPLR